MRYLAGCLSACVALGLGVGCVETADDPGDDDGMAGESSSNGGEPSSRGGDGGAGAGGGGCIGDADTETLVEGVEAFSTALAVSDEGVAYVTRVTVGAASVLSVVGLDGTGDGVIYSTPDTSRISSLAWSGSDIVFLEAVQGETKETLYTIPAGGGDATSVTTTPFDQGRILGADADAVYIHVNSGAHPIVRVSLSSGDVETVGKVPASGSVTHHSISEGELFFLGGSGSATVYRLPLDGTDIAPEELFNGADNPVCTFPLGGLTATPTKVVCGYSGMGAVSRSTGESDGAVIAADLLNPGTHLVVGSSGEAVYMVLKQSLLAAGPLLRAQSDGTREVALVCDVANVPTQTIDGFFPLPNEYQVGIGGGRIVWVEEEQPEPDRPIVSIRSAPL